MQDAPPRSPRIAIPIAPSLDSVGAARPRARRRQAVDRRVVHVAILSIGLGVVSAVVAKALTALIGLVTQLVFYDRWSTAFVEPANHYRGAWVIVLPPLGGLVVGAMARWGSKAIRGHG